MRPRVLLGALAVAIACGAENAHAAERIVLPRLPGPIDAAQTLGTLAGPSPAGARVVFGMGTPTRGWTIVAGVPGEPGRVVGQIPGQIGSSLSLSASTTRIAVVRHAFTICDLCRDPRTTLDALMAGPIDGPLTWLTGCSGSCATAATEPRFTAALAGDQLGFVDSGGQPSPQGGVLDLVSGATTALPRATSVAPAGDVVATVEDPAPLTAPPPAGFAPQYPALVVRRTSDAGEIYRGPGLPSYTRLAAFPGGTAAFITTGAGGAALVVSDPSDPAGRPVATFAAPAAIAGYGNGLVLVVSGRENALRVVGIDGTEHGAGTPADQVGTAGFGGGYVTYAQRTCVTTVITRWVAATPFPANPDLHCATATSAGAGRLRGTTTADAPLHCTETAPGGCLARVTLTAVRRGRLPHADNGAERSYVLGRDAVALNPGETASASIALKRGARTWLRRHRSLRLRVTILPNAPKADLATGDPGHSSTLVALHRSAT